MHTQNIHHTLTKVLHYTIYLGKKNILSNQIKKVICIANATDFNDNAEKLLNNNNNNRLNGLCSGTTRVGWYQKKHSALA